MSNLTARQQVDTVSSVIERVRSGEQFTAGNARQMAEAGARGAAKGATAVEYGLRESAQWTADRRATAIDYYSDAMAENLRGTFYLGGAARAVVVSGPDVAAGLRFNLTADHMLSPYLSMGGGSGYEIAGGVEGGYIPGDVSRFNGDSINVNISAQVGVTLVVPVDPLRGDSCKPGVSISYGSGGGGSVTYTRTFSWE